MSATVTRATYTAKEVAELLGISPWNVYRVVKEDGDISGVKPIWVGRRVVFPKRAIDELVHNGGEHAA